MKNFLMQLNVNGRKREIETDKDFELELYQVNARGERQKTLIITGQALESMDEDKEYLYIRAYDPHNNMMTGAPLLFERPEFEYASLRNRRSESKERRSSSS